MHHEQIEVKLLVLVILAIITLWSVLTATENVAEKVVFNHSRYEKRF